MFTSSPRSAVLARARLDPDARALPGAPAGSALAPAAGVRSGPDTCGLAGPAGSETALPAPDDLGGARYTYLSAL